MVAVVIRRGPDGWEGVGDVNAKRWDQWRRIAANAAVGATLQFEWKQPRSPKHHGLFFAQLAALFDRQEQFDDVDKLRMWLTVGAGYADFVPGPKGRMVAMPQSIAWVRMDETEFSELHAKVNAFLWTDHARQFLWPMLTPQQTYDAVDQLLTEFSR